MDESDSDVKIAQHSWEKIAEYNGSEVNPWKNEACN
jgi:hypothetical protein